VSEPCLSGRKFRQAGINLEQVGTLERV